MASKAHQKITGLIARKMREEEYEIVSYDGNEKIISDVALHTPPYIKKHRPDLIGVNFKTNSLCIGEAKTSHDLNSTRTKEQFLDFSNVLTKSGQAVKLIIGIPKSAENKLILILRKLNISNKPNLSYIWMPDELLIDDEEEL